MQTFLFQTGVQGAIIAALWFGVARDATKIRETRGASPGGVSPFAWGALCGLTWIALLLYFKARSTASESLTPLHERNLLPWWIGLAAAAGIWSASNAVRDDANNAAQHAILALAFVVCAAIARYRDRAVRSTDPRA